MKKIIKRPLFWGILLFTGAFIPLLFYAEAPDVFEIENALITSLGLGIAIAFAGGTWKGLRSNLGQPMDATDVLILGIFLAWKGIALVFIFLWLYRVTGDELYRNHPIAMFGRWEAITGGLLHMAASGSVNGKVPLKAYRRSGIVAGIGLAVALVLITLGLR